MKYLFILNDSPYGSQRTYNALRLVRSLATGNTKVAIFLLGDGVVSAIRRQSPADASYTICSQIHISGTRIRFLRRGQRAGVKQCLLFDRRLNRTVCFSGAWRELLETREHICNESFVLVTKTGIAGYLKSQAVIFALGGLRF